MDEEKAKLQDQEAGKEIEEKRIPHPADKYIILLGDGMGDFPLDELGGKTVLEAARTPFMDLITRMGELGLVNTIPDDMEPGSDVANMSLLGYDPAQYYTGRGPLEAAAMGVAMNPEDVAFRCNLVTLSFREGRVFMEDYSAGHISTEEARILVTDLAELVKSRSFELFPGVSYRHLLLWRGGPEGIATVPPHDYTGHDVTEAWRVYEDEPLLYEVLKKAINFFHRHPVNEKRQQEGKLPANALWPWGQGRRPVVATIPQQYDLEGTVIAAVDLIKGLGIWAGLDAPDIKGATGFLDTDYGAKARAALRELKEKDFVFLHVEAPDEAGHLGDVQEKIKAIEHFDKEVVGPVFEGLKNMGCSFRMMIVTDHYTPVAIKTHAKSPVPFVIYDSLDVKNNPHAAFNEPAAKKTGIVFQDGFRILPHFIGAEPRYVELDPKKKK